ncbi:hypothetical protein MFIFM68171_03859 [Madurella fahalii]|uniref:Uncharacterized protein n=1 Tax=Madurella fahalii TaxID=1157608 RepID=A0ABQ0G7L3_9PEZI
MDSQKFHRRRSAAAIFLNLAATICLAALLGLGVFVSGTRIAFVWERSDGWVTVTNVSPSTWNVAVVIIGTAVGIIASIAVSSHDAFLSQLDLASPRGVSAIFLRPLTAKRGLDQLVNGCMAAERAVVVLLMLVTAVTSTATVALFSAQTTTEELTNDRPSFPLDALNMTFFRNWNHGVIAIEPPSFSPELIAPALASFMHRSAYVNGLIARGERGIASDYGPFMPVAQDGMLGDVSYRGLWTAGVGINVRSYLEYPGPTGYFYLPGNYTLHSLEGEVFGTIINATCENRTVDYVRYSEMYTDIGRVTLTTVAKRGTGTAFFPGTNISYDALTNITGGTPTIGGITNITVISNRITYEFGSSSLVLGSNITLPSPGHWVNIPSGGAVSADEPVHVILVAGGSDELGQVFECRYSGWETLVEVSVPSPLAPLEIGQVTTGRWPIGPAVKHLVAKELHKKMDLITRGFVDAGYNKFAHNTTAEFADTLATVLSQSAQACISLMRQMIEIAHLYEPPNASPATFATVRITIQRLGGSSRGWLAVYGFLLIGSLIGLFRVSVGGRAVEFEAQDAGILLAKASGDEEFGPKTKVQFAPGTGLIWGGRTEGVYVVQRYPSDNKEQGQGDVSEKIRQHVTKRKGARRRRRYTF